MQQSWLDWRRVVVVIGVATGGCGGGGGGGGKTNKMNDGGADAEPPPTQVSSALRIVSNPVGSGAVGQRTRYRVVASEPGASYSLKRAPVGATIDSAGVMTWTPTDDQGGAQAFEIQATAGGETTTQEFMVMAARPRVQVQTTVDPSSPNVTAITVDAPLSRVRGASVQMDPGSLDSKVPVDVTISALENAPVPIGARTGGVPSSELQPVELGPSGTTFRKPVRVQLPATQAVLAKGKPDVLTYDYGSGRWNKVKLLAYDKDKGLALAEVNHFSTYVVAPAANLFAPQLSLGGAACRDSLVVRAPLAMGLAQLPASTVNGYAGAGATAADVLAGLKEGEALQVFVRATAHSHASVDKGANTEKTAWLLGSAARLAGGQLRVNVVSDSHATSFLKIPAAMAPSDPEVAPWLTGARAHFLFGGLGSLSAGATVNLEASLYLVAAADADLPPPEVANPVDNDEAAVATLAALDGYDDDCDGAPNDFDPSPAGDLPPTLTATPDGLVRLVVGSAGKLSITSLSSAGGARFAWSASDEALGLDVADDGASATMKPTLAGTFIVDVVASAGTGSARYGWAVIVDPPATNSKPSVSVSASAFVARAGEKVVLYAVGSDREQSSLAYAWSAARGGSLSASEGDEITFAAAEAGDYEITCVANDGLENSPPARVTISVVSRTTNRPPAAPSVTPMTAVLEHAPGVAASITIAAAATDPDGDVVTYEFTADPSTPPTVSLVKMGSSATVSTSRDGVYFFYVTGQDAHGAVSPWTPVKIAVIPTLSAASVDNDKDGYPAPGDCNDTDAKIFPGQREVCGDGVDQNCDGKDLPAVACDADGDRYSMSDGDCNDNNAAISPGAEERCDGIDNNCNGKTDEDFAVGVACTLGEGACQAKGLVACDASLSSVICKGIAGQPQPEICDGKDNDCDGKVDNVATGTAGDIKNCGGCNLACAVPPHTVPACETGGCTATCEKGFADTDNNAGNGCECALTNGGVEICDGLDNDCNGVADDGADEVFYPGPSGTLGIGQCASGVRSCNAGKSELSRAPRVPETERCDGLDNDCNGKVDEGIDTMSDPTNCGGCGVTCSADARCDKGKCTGGVNSTPDAGLPPDAVLAPPDVSDKDVPAPEPDAQPPLTRDGGGGSTTADGGAPPSMPAPEILAMCLGPAGTPVCTDLARDLLNCGACGTICAANEVCANGHCSPANACPSPAKPCPDPKNPTGVVCTDMMYDPMNCGGCGVRCEGVPCQRGVCTPGNPPDYDGGASMECPAVAPAKCVDPTRGTSYCADLKFDINNCGGCGVRCPLDARCDLGKCVPNMLPGDGGSALDASAITCMIPAPNPCSTPLRGTFCTDLMHDPSNCGTCGLVCPAGAVCDLGKCSGGSPPPPPPPATCPGYLPNGCAKPDGLMYCTNVLSDPGNCGGCGKYCPPGILCEMGSCGGTAAPDGGTTPACPSPAPSQCHATTGEYFCTDLQTDLANCGACLNACPGGSHCDRGTCLDNVPICPPSLPNTCTDAAGTRYCTDFMTDPANCGGCHLQCPNGVMCYAGACTGTPPPPPPPPPPVQCPPSGPNGCPLSDLAVSCTNLLTDPADCGRCGLLCGPGMFCVNGMCAATLPPPPPDGGVPPEPVCPPTIPSLCHNSLDQGFCADLSTDMANCGACGHACASGARCEAGVCSGIVTNPCGSYSDAPNSCLDASAGKYYCTNFARDPANCGGCRIGCAAGTFCNAGLCGTTPPPDPTCGPEVPNVCPIASGGSYCTDFQRDPGNCGGCGRVCAMDTACFDGRCSAGSTTCGPPFNVCPTGCTVLSDDPANCGVCGNACNGVCEFGACKTAGSNPFGAPCTASHDCTPGSICLDAPRFGWPGGYCSTPCDPMRPCAANQTCVAGASGGGFGTCRATCTTDAQCGRPGYLCAGGACHPDCRQALNVCPSGTMCDAGGRCVAGTPTPTCPPAMAVCGDDVATGKFFCADLSRDPGNCGTCGTTCASDHACQAGNCVFTNATFPGLMACPGTGGAGAACVAVYRDPSNCGACGNVCPANNTCAGGQCVAPPTCDPPMQVCSEPGYDKQYCTNVNYDPRNCGACGVTCPSDKVCQMGVCATPQTPDGGAPTPSCPPDLNTCFDPTGHPYCTDIRADPRNCGACGRVCISNVCNNYLCAPTGGGTDASAPVPSCPIPLKACQDPNGVTYCADFKIDPKNCGGCGIFCPTGVCSSGACGSTTP